MGRSYKIILDANILLAPTEMSIDIMGEIKRIVPGKFELVTVEPVKKELERKRRGVGIKIMQALGVKTLNAKGKADDAILELAKKLRGSIVATNDEELKKKLRAAGIPVIFIRGKKKLELEGYIG